MGQNSIGFGPVCYVKNGGESSDLNDRGHGSSCCLRTNQVNKLIFSFLNTQPIFIKQSALTSVLFDANAHFKVTPQYAVVFRTSSNKYCFQYFDFALTSAGNYYKL